MSADYFLALNTMLFLLLILTVYSPKYIQHQSYANATEFIIYAVTILSVIVAIWWKVRKFSFSPWVLLVVQVGIVLHFAGAFVTVDGGRLYDTHLLGIRFDKYVHTFNALAGSILVAHILKKARDPIPLLPLVIVLCVLGAGAIVEIVEYLVSLNVVRNGVGDYDNNMQDLIGNLVGTLIYQLFAKLRLSPWHAMPASTPIPEA